MSYFQEKSVWIAGGLGSMLAFVTEHTDISFTILLGMMIVDVLSGLARGFQKKKLKSSIGQLGILKKAGILLAVAMGYMLDILVNGGNPVFSIMMVWVSIGNEGLSIIENLSAMGVKAVPKSVKNVLAQMSEDGKNIQSDKDGFVTVPVSDHSAKKEQEALKEDDPIKVDEDVAVEVVDPKEDEVPTEVHPEADEKKDKEVEAMDSDEIIVDTQEIPHESAKNKDGFK